MPSLNYIPSLEGLRAVAILLVMAYHFIEINFAFTSDTVWDPHLLRFGWVGVDIFFVISGFLITRILLHTKSQPHYYFNFYVRRALRIFPLYYVFLIIYFLLPVLLKIPMPEAWSTIKEREWYFWFYVSDFYYFHFKQWPGVGVNHLWSLAIEEKFYLLWPLLVSNLRTISLKTVCLVLLISTLSIRIAFISWNWKGPLINYTFPLARMDCIVAGAWLAIHHFEQKNTSKKFIHTILFVSLFIYGAIYLYAGNLTPFTNAMQLIGFTLNAFLGIALVELCIQDSSRFAHILSKFPFPSIGRYSYSLYLFHLPCLYVVRHLTSQLALQAVLWLGSCLILSTLSWKFFEAPILKLKERFA